MDTDRIGGAATNIAGKIEGAAGRVSGDLGTQAQGLADQASGAAQNAYGRAKDAVRDVAEDAPESMRQGADALAKQIQANPLGAIAVAAIAGYALAALMHGRR
jgi:uncharacterized protein YjbJ (UPF0337 family)